MDIENLEQALALHVKQWHEEYKVDWRLVSFLLREQADFCYMKHSAEKYLSENRE